MKMKRVPELRRSSLASSLVSNAVYVSHRDSIFPEFPYNKINTQTPSPMEMRERYSFSPGRNPNSFTRQHSGCGRVLWEEGTVVPPEHNFSAFNRGRSKSTLRTSEWQYPRSQLIYMRELGEGQFGKVLLMKAQRGIAGFKRDLPVAVKTLTSRDPQKVAKFMEEAELMKKFSHPNIVSLLGVSTDDVLDDDNAPLMILEYMPYGDLHAFLENNRPGSETLSVSLGDAHFVSFATDVAEALKFIGEERFVHRDIAARNCLVGAGLRIKMADFGLAQRLNQNNYYLDGEGGVLPIRTMAPEIFLTGQFTISSDVWSYGVLLWEMVSYGALPLPGMTSRDIAEAAQTRTLHHTTPPDCPPVLGSLMAQCTNHYPNLRPLFTDILTQLTQHDP
ncbi:Inactive tyrosine-protein kinase transmembrane receptor ROR1 [Geodia barretti]|uniref:Inactive tyrosine-protein kinase transmembrane receptor ROR1 n=3 Tax=Geodia barretti TaxID=519541 RepID=A0AA35RH30_GEOBA|nr:Inactive tyrosine-protein kinase transmembrane receptor ROR1 [Geodia barretti]